MTEKQPFPALLGGDRAVTLDQTDANRWPVLTPEDEQAVLAVIRDGNISTHPVIRDLEADYAAFTGRKHALAHHNGTSALMAAFYAIDLKPGDEVIVPSATFWASVLPMTWLGAVPVFCESEDERFGLDPEDIERKITAKTKAIVVVHLWGMPSKMTEIFAIAQKHNLKIVEDASHAHGASWNGRACGSLGDVSVFSLQGDKLAPGGEGGMLLCDDDALLERATCLGDITRIIELTSPARRFAATGFGMKTRIAPLSAAIARVQLSQLGRRNRQRNDNLIYLSNRLEALGFDCFLAPEHIRRVYFEFIIRPRPDQVPLAIETLIRALQAEGCMVQLPRYPLLHQQPFFTEGHLLDILRLPPHIQPPVYHADDLPQTTAGNDSLIKLPSFPRANRPLLDQYIQAFEKVISSIDALQAQA